MGIKVWILQFVVIVSCRFVLQQYFVGQNEERNCLQNYWKVNSRLLVFSVLSSKE